MESPVDKLLVSWWLVHWIAKLASFYRPSALSGEERLENATRVNSFLFRVGLDNKYTPRCSEWTRRLIRFVPDKDTSLIIGNVPFVSSALSVPSLCFAPKGFPRISARSALINRRGAINWISGVNVNNRAPRLPPRRGDTVFLLAVDR